MVSNPQRTQGNANIPLPGFVTEPESCIRMNSENIQNSTGLFLFQDWGDLFIPQPAILVESGSLGLREETREDGRENPINSSRISQLVEPIQNASPHFGLFTRLPQAFTVLERQELPRPGANEGLRNLFDTARRLLFGSEATETENTVISSSNTFTLPSDLLGLSFEGVSQGAKAERHSVILLERRTDYYLGSAAQQSGNTVENSIPFICSYFENHHRFERCYEQPDYLAAALEKVVLQDIRRLHSNNIIYSSMKFTSFSKKTWFGPNASIANKIPLKAIDTTTVSYKPLTLGLADSPVVSSSLNVLFTAQFDKTLGVTYRTNRMVSCPCVESHSEMTTIPTKALLDRIGKGLGENSVFSQYPLVGLIPVFQRGSIMQTSNVIEFRGVVNNSGTDNSIGEFS